MNSFDVGDVAFLLGMTLAALGGWLMGYPSALVLIGAILIGLALVPVVSMRSARGRRRP